MNDEHSKRYIEADYHLQTVEKLLGLIDQLAHGPASCDHTLIQSYVGHARGRLQAARKLLNSDTKSE